MQRRWTCSDGFHCTVIDVIVHRMAIKFPFWACEDVVQSYTAIIVKEGKDFTSVRNGLARHVLILVNISMTNSLSKYSYISTISRHFTISRDSPFLFSLTNLRFTAANYSQNSGLT